MPLGHAVRELGDDSVVQQVVELYKTAMSARDLLRREACEGHPPAWTLGHLDRHENFAAFTQLGTFRDKAQSPEVHVAARDDGDEALVLALKVIADDVRLETGQGKGARGFGYGSCF